MMQTTLEQKIRSHVAIGSGDECWPWNGPTDRDGYGKFKQQRNGVVTWMRAHRVAWEIANHAIPAGLVIRHRCDNPACCNPAHLETGTPIENRMDCVSRGRGKGPAKLTADQITAIRADARTNVEVAREYGVTHSNISAIRRGKSWGRVA